MDRTPTLYHGTDARITRMNGKERNEMIEAVMIARDFLYLLYDKKLNGGQFLISASDNTPSFCMKAIAPNCYFPADKKILQSYVQNALSCISAAKNGNTAYEYLTDGFYLTTLPFRACNFAQGGDSAQSITQAGPKNAPSTIESTIETTPSAIESAMERILSSTYFAS